MFVGAGSLHHNIWSVTPLYIIFLVNPIPIKGGEGGIMYTQLPHKLFLAKFFKNLAGQVSRENFLSKILRNIKVHWLDISFGTFHHFLCFEAASVETDVRW